MHASKIHVITMNPHALVFLSFLICWQLKQFIHFFSHTILDLSSFANTHAACNIHASAAEFSRLNYYIDS